MQDPSIDKFKTASPGVMTMAVNGAENLTENLELRNVHTSNEVLASRHGGNDGLTLRDLFRGFIRMMGEVGMTNINQATIMSIVEGYALPAKRILGDELIGQKSLSSSLFIDQFLGAARVGTGKAALRDFVEGAYTFVLATNN